MIESLIYIVLIFLATGAAIFVLCHFWQDNYGPSIAAVVISIVLGLCAFGAILGIVVSSYSKEQCVQLGQQAHLPTKFNIYNGCFIDTEHGWLPQPQYIQLTQTNAPGN